ncbi:hypothetical protein FOZ60_011602 [Perkinsus olseni]|uniref:P-type ATPase A domain-containing protein n=1 Tax=Perkinsus olseni TaxID=32597 RepID=A0A7J6NCW4_PEROL|nr:hypothetical protein FOZ60_011602 [Perkinsus olseni]
MGSYRVELGSLPAYYSRFVDPDSQEEATAHIDCDGHFVQLTGASLKPLKIPLHRHGGAVWFLLNHVAYILMPTERVFRRGMFYDSIPQELRSPGVQQRNGLLRIFKGTALSGALPSSSWVWLGRALWTYLVCSPVMWFQGISIGFWMVDGYYDYAFTILLLTVVARGLHLRLLHQTYRATKRAADESEEGMVCRVSFDGMTEEAPVTDLVPGDVVKLQASSSIPADCILVRGSATIEHSFISGESEVYTLLAASPGFPPGPESLLLCGGRLVDATVDAAFLVIATGNQTLQGLHLQAVANRRSGAAEIRLKRAVLGCVVLLATAGFIAFILSWSSLQQVALRERVMSSVDVLTDALPPALPVALLVLHLSCSSSLRLPPGVLPAQRGSIPPLILAGLVDQVVLDKTNTVTTGAASVVGMACGDPMVVVRSPHRVSGTPNADLLHRALKVSHCFDRNRHAPDPVDEAILDYVHRLEDGKLKKDDGDESSPTRASNRRQHDGVPTVSGTQSFATYSSGFSVEDLHLPGSSTEADSVIVAHSPFDATTRLTGVLCGAPDSSTVFYVRGAPEAICAASKPSTIPSNFYEILDRYTTSGLRVLAYACRDNSDVEESGWMLPCNLRFLGLIFIHTTVHSASTETVSELTRADVKCVLCTGDAEGTARASASAIGLISCSSLGYPLMQEEAVHARMTPWSKKNFVNCCNATGRTVMMCGDGTNDIPALCAAAVGLVVSSAPPYSKWNTTGALQYLAGGCLVGIDASKGPWLCCEVMSQGRGAMVAAVVLIRLAVLPELDAVRILMSHLSEFCDINYAERRCKDVSSEPSVCASCNTSGFALCDCLFVQSTAYTIG